MPDSRISVAGVLLVIALMVGFISSARSASIAPNSTVVPHQQETSDHYVARVFFDAQAKDGSDAYYEILQDNKSVYLQKAKNKGEKFFIGTMYKEDSDAGFVKMGMDIAGNGQPGLLISEWSGYANCCLTLHIFQIGPTFRKLGTIDAEFGDAGPHFEHPSKDSKASGLAVQVHDWNFANWNTDFADSPAPRVILRFNGDGYSVAPDWMRSPAPAAPDLEAQAVAVKTYAASAAGGTWPKAKVSPKLWATMLDLIYDGHTDEAWKFLDQAWPPKVQGKETFASDFRAQLAKSPYWPAVKTIQASSSPTSPAAGAE